MDASIQAAYVMAIGKADNFVYVENQFFRGSAPHWPNDEDDVKDSNRISNWLRSAYRYVTVGPTNFDNMVNQVPLAIVEKLEARIALGQHFCAYSTLDYRLSIVRHCRTFKFLLDHSYGHETL